jgi:dienelactone hydrolase
MRRRAISTGLIGIAALVATACSSHNVDEHMGGTTSKPITASATAPVTSGAMYAKPGPYVAGVTTVTIGDRQAEVWYPADPGAQAGKPKDTYYIRSWLGASVQGIISPTINPPYTTDAYRGIPASSHGPFPVVLFAHGSMGYRDQSTFLTTHLAQWGFVVVAPDMRENGLEFVLGGQPSPARQPDEVFDAAIAAVRAADIDATSVLRGAVKPGKIGVVGHSLGGFQIIHYAAQANVAVYIPLAGAANFEDGSPSTALPGKPSLFMGGTIDTVVAPKIVRSSFDAAAKPSELVEIDNVGHLNAFSDICQVGASGGGVIALAVQAGLPIPAEVKHLGTDGCQASALPSPIAQEVTDQFVTAELRWALGIDATPVGLKDTPKLHADLAPATFTITTR